MSFKLSKAIIYTFATLSIKLYLNLYFLSSSIDDYAMVLVNFSVIQFIVTLFTSFTAELYLKNGRFINKQIIFFEFVTSLLYFLIVLLLILYTSNVSYSILFLFIAPSFMWQIKFNKLVDDNKLSSVNFIEFCLVISLLITIIFKYINSTLVVLLLLNSRILAINLAIKKRHIPYIFFLTNWNSFLKFHFNFEFKHFFNLLLKNVLLLDLLYFSYFFGNIEIALMKFSKSIASFSSVATGNLYLHYRSDLGKKLIIPQVLYLGTGFILMFTLTYICLNDHIHEFILSNYKNLGISKWFLYFTLLGYLVHGIIFGGLRYTTLMRGNINSSTISIFFIIIIIISSPFVIDSSNIIYSPLFITLLGSMFSVFLLLKNK